jgi:hypothetical protein
VRWLGAASEPSVDRVRSYRDMERLCSLALDEPGLVTHRRFVAGDRPKIEVAVLVWRPLCIAPDDHDRDDGRLETPQSLHETLYQSGLESRDRHLPATPATYAATASICVSLKRLRKDGIAPTPFVTRSTTVCAEGFAASRFGPTRPVAPASASV